jgi:hypothetical protein
MPSEDVPPCNLIQSYPTFWKNLDLKYSGYILLIFLP